MFQLPSSAYKSLVRFKNVPPIINSSKIHIITDLSYLLDLENKYDKFLETNLELLDLYNIIDELIDIRDTITLQICRLRRKKELYEHNKYQNQIQSQSQKEEQTNSVKSVLSNTGLNLTKNQKSQGYILCQNTLKEYKCGCKTIEYYKPNLKKNQNIKQNSRQTPVIQKQQYCYRHLHCLKIKYVLEEELTKINMELSSITRKENEV